MSDDSQDQGFIKLAIEIDTKSKQYELQARPNDYQARYITSGGLIRKEPVQCYKRFQKIKTPSLNPYQQYLPQEKRIEYHNKYFNTEQYQLIYNRSRSFKNSDSQWTMNFISLECLKQYKSDNYSVIKPVQLQYKSNKNSLEFESRFQGGNLIWAFRNIKNCKYYTLFMQNDTNTKGYNQWFYFSIKNGQPKTTYRFSIVNFKKKFSFFKDGMKPMVLIIGSQEQGWSQIAGQITYQRSFTRNSDNEITKYYSLSFNVYYQNTNDIMYIAAGLPYSYSRLVYFLKQLSSFKNSQIVNETRSIAYSLGNNQIPYLTITGLGDQSDRQNIILLARQHPGQTWSSYLMEQFLQNLCRSSEQNKLLLSKFIFRIFPMVNVDGVIYGNFRCDLSGVDLNRMWKNPSKFIHPQIYAIKDEIQKITISSKIVCCFDLHGHSKNYNMFSYSCKTDNISCRVLPFILSKLSSNFDFKSCTFGISKYKSTTARAVIYQLIRTTNVLTIESSFYGAKINQVIQQFHPIDFNFMAKNILSALKSYFNNQQLKQQVENIIKHNIGELISMVAEKQEGDSGSQSNPQADQIDMNKKIGTIIPKTVMMSLEQIIPFDRKIQKSKFLNEFDEYSKSAFQRKKYNEKQKKSVTSVKKNKDITVKTLINRKRNENSNKLEKQSDQNQVQIYNNKKNISKQYQTIKTDRIKYQIPKKQNALNPIRFVKQALVFKNQNPALITNEKEEDKQIELSCAQKASSLKFRFMLDTESREEQSNLLCVFSETKKKAHLAKIKHNSVEKKQRQSHSYRTKIIRDPQNNVNKKIQTLIKLKQKQKNSDSLVSKIWRENISRYTKDGFGHVFMS